MARRWVNSLRPFLSSEHLWQRVVVYDVKAVAP
jgi:hypothetical protein